MTSDQEAVCGTCGNSDVTDYEELVKAARLIREEQQAEYECGFCTGGNDSHDDECVMPPFLAALTHIEESLGGRKDG